MPKNRYLDQYFAFSVNSPIANQVYGDEIMIGSCLLYQNNSGLFVPVGDDTIRWHTGSTDCPPQITDVTRDIERLGVDKIFTISLRDYPNDQLWGLKNLLAPSCWDYEKDPSPPAEIYFSIGNKFENEFGRLGITIEEGTIEEEFW